MKTPRIFGRVLITSEPYLKEINGELIPLQNIAILHQHKSDISYAIRLEEFKELYEVIFFFDILSIPYLPSVVKLIN